MIRYTVYLLKLYLFVFVFFFFFDVDKNKNNFFFFFFKFTDLGLDGGVGGGVNSLWPYLDEIQLTHSSLGDFNRILDKQFSS